jgi:hypothetical protein
VQFQIECALLHAFGARIRSQWILQPIDATTAWKLSGPRNEVEIVSSRC